MVNCEFKKNYNFFLGLIIFCLVGIVSATIIAIALQAYGIIVSVAIFVILAIYCLFKYLTLKKQFLSVSKDGFNAYVITYKGAQKPTKISTNLDFVVNVSYHHNLLVLKNNRGQDLTIYNLKNAKKAAEDINNFLSNSR